MSDRTRLLMERLGHMKTYRSNHEDTWEEILSLMAPFRGDIHTRRIEGAKRVTPVFDSTAMQAADAFVNAMKSAIVPSDSDWLKLHLAGADVEQRKVLDRVSHRILERLADSNFYVVMSQVLRDFAILGNGVLMVGQKKTLRGSPFGELYFEAVPLGGMYWMFGSHGEPIMVARELEFPTIDAAAFLGERPGRLVEERLRAGMDFEPTRIVHFVWRDDTLASSSIPPTARNKPWQSIYLEPQAQEEVGQSGGFETCPYICARWMVVDGEQYGRGRGHLARPDAKGVNELRRQILVALGKELNPPFLSEDGTLIELDVGPNGQVVVRPPSKMEPQYLRSGSDFTAADEVARQDREQIRAAFMADVFAEPETQPRSAFESRARIERGFQRLGASSETIDAELLRPTVTSVMEKLRRTGDLEELVALERELGRKSRVHFASPFFVAQRQSALQRADSVVERRLRIFQVTQDPAWLDDIDFDEIRRLEVETADVPTRIYRSDEEVNARRQARGAKNARREKAAMEEAQAQSGSPGPLLQGGFLQGAEA